MLKTKILKIRSTSSEKEGFSSISEHDGHVEHVTSNNVCLIAFGLLVSEIHV